MMGKGAFAVIGLALLAACAPDYGPQFRSGLEIGSAEGFFLSERKDVQHRSGEAKAGRDAVTWQVEGTELNYQITTQRTNACYAAGDVTHEMQAAPDTDVDVLVLRVEVTYSGGVCAQVVQDIVFDGKVSIPSTLFTVRTEVIDQRSGRINVIE